MMTTDEQLDALEAAAKAATRGPWTWNGLSVDADGFDLCSCTDWRSPINRNGMANACYIAAANPSVILDLIAELRRMQGELKQMQAERDWIARKYTDAFNALGRHDRMTFLKAISIAKEATCPEN